MTELSIPALPSTELLIQVIDTNATGIMIINHENNIVFWNQWLEKSSGINKETAINQNLFTLFPTLKNSRLNKAMELSISKGNASFISQAFNKTPLPLYSDSNQTKPIHQLTYIKPIRLKDNQRYCFIQITDCSNAVYREQQLRKMANKAKELSALKSGFVSSVSHELRTPLTSIMGALGLLRSGVEKINSDTYKSMLDIAYNNANRLLILIGDILDIEKIESGNMKFTFLENDINEIVETCLTQNKGLADKYKINFNFKKDESLPKISVDKDRIFQVLNNLLSNAAKFEPNNGTVEVTTKLEYKKIRIAVVDHGSGIPDEFKDRIFQSFSQADVSNTKDVAGTGLGLAISKTIIEHHKGEINFTTEPSKKTCFYFTLPIDFE